MEAGISLMTGYMRVEMHPMSQMRTKLRHITHT